MEEKGIVKETEKTVTIILVPDQGCTVSCVKSVPLRHGHWIYCKYHPTSEATV